jgi:ABC-type multidrug transport system permease subunit
MRSVEAVNGLMFTTMFPITFLANTFAPTDNMPHVLRVIAEWNPISSLVQAVRQLWGNDIPVPADAQLPLHHPIITTLIWTVGLTADIDKGIVDRMRSLPINPSAVLVGRSISSLLHSSIGILVMSLTGLLVGWRIRGGFADAVLAYALLLLWGFAMIWIGILVGSAMRSVEAVNGVMFTTMFPITFLANTFAPTEHMPSFLRTIAEWNPISSLVQAVRELWGNAEPAPAAAALPLHHPVLTTVIWCAAITLVTAPLALRAFNRRTQQ